VRSEELLKFKISPHWDCYGDTIALLIQSVLVGLEDLDTILVKGKIFFVSIMSRPDLGTTLPPIELVLWVKRQRLEAHHSHLSPA
jgi:hypothetical protein